MPNHVLQRLVDEREQLNRNIDQVLDTANEDERDPSESERELIHRHRERLSAIEPQIVELLALEEDRHTAADARAVLNRRREAPPNEPRPEPQPDDDDDEEGGEGTQYRTFAQYARDLIIVRHDKIGATVGRRTREQAQRRLERAVAPVLMANVLSPPQYISQIMQVIDSARPIVAASNSIGLTSGKVQYPVLGNRPDVAEQTVEKTEAGDGAMTVTMAEKVAKTYLVAANFSWQVIQWSDPNALQLWFDLAAASYAAKTEGEAGAVLAAADTTPATISANADLAAWMAAITAAAGGVYAATGRFADTIAADPATGFKILGLVTNVSPVFLATGQGNLATGAFPSLGGLRFVISNGLPANTVIVGDFDALLTAEVSGSPVEARAVEPAIGGLEVGIIGAFLAVVTDPGAFQEINPTGA